MSILALGCGINKGLQDTSTSDDGSETTESDGSDGEDGSDTPEDPPIDIVEGCKWLTGSWTVYTCVASEGFNASFGEASQCAYTVTSQNPLWVGANAGANGSGFGMNLTDSTPCSGYFDGKLLTGACSSGGTPCWFYAIPE